LFRGGRKSAGARTCQSSKYRTFTKQITAYAESRCYVMIDQFTHVDIDLFWVSWKLGPREKGKRLSTLRRLFRFCLHRKSIEESPVSPDIKPAEWGQQRGK
jgi:site-specific recombinase XerD